MPGIKTLYNHFLNSRGICTDSRKAGENQIFFALKGENFDGNKYAAKALELGCSFAVVDDPEVAQDDRFFLTDNCLESLQELARHHRQQLGIPIIGITGSNGKTTTKGLILSVLSTGFRTLATEGNLNNHIGVPLTILNIKEEEIAIIEMGANHPGEIDFLSRIAQPDYGIITNIGKAHLEGFGSFEGIKQAKSELYRYLDEKKGTIFINGSNDILIELSRLDRLKRIYYKGGPSPLCDGFINSSKDRLDVTIRFMKEGGETRNASINLTGAYNLENILAAACIGSYFKIPPDKVIEGLENYRPTGNRSQVIKTGKNILISDAYNANPTSMKEAIDNFSLQPENCKLAVLGDMLELGKWSEEEHRNILLDLEKRDFTDAFLVGSEFMKFKSEFPFLFFHKVEDLHEHFRKNPVEDCLILLKGSRGIRLEKVMDIL